ncbi:MAG: hypothetical protein Q4A00_01715 [Flavobacteriaceae bacterium]|nr:hypothetical protein [Flavobacteriaceae bacterium]
MSIFKLENLLPYAFVLIITFPFLMLIKHFVYQYITLKKRELHLLTDKSNSQIKLQAYERMLIFLERLRPQNLVEKFDKELSTREFVFLLEKSIKEELEYNTSQQLYINDESWENIIRSKDNVLHLLHRLLEVNPNISLEEFKTLLIMNYLEGEDYISDSIQNLKIDIHSLI